MKNHLLIFFVLFSAQALCLQLPQSLDESDRKEVTRILGFGTSSKLLTNPFPLGGYSGVELGLSMETIDTSSIARLGDKSQDTKEFTYPRLSLGKGLYNDVDLFFSFVPYSDSTRVAEFGGILKWCFYQAEFLPLSLSFIVHGSDININDSFVSETIGGEFVAGINVDNFSLYFGGGRLQSDARFLAGDSGTDGVIDSTDSNLDKENLMQQRLRTAHTFIGFTFHFSEVFLAVQLDRYRDPVYSAKLGLRL